jgi:hypothetical protein
LKYDPQNGSWYSIGFKGMKRYAANGFAIDNYGYIFFDKYGYSANNANLVDVWQSDPSNK